MKKTILTINDQALFRDATKDVKPLTQNTVFHVKRLLKQEKENVTKQVLHTKKEENCAFYFSDEYQPQLNKEAPNLFLRHDVPKSLLKQLRRGHYEPDFFLDLHGLTKREAKLELAALIIACLRERKHCAAIMHGHGKHILKQQLPFWLAQHPNILAFHHAPPAYGGQAALLVLISAEDGTFPFFD